MCTVTNPTFDRSEPVMAQRGPSAALLQFQYDDDACAAGKVLLSPTLPQEKTNRLGRTTSTDVASASNPSRTRTR